LQLHDQSSTKVIAKLLQEYFKDDKVLFIFDDLTIIDILQDVLFQNHDNILNRSNLDKEQHLFEDLIKELGYHPLGIQHAVAFIEESQITLTGYFQLLKQQPIQVLAEKVALDERVPRSVMYAMFKILDPYGL